MYFDYTVKIPEAKGKLVMKKIKNTTYINYEYDRIYNPETKTTTPKRTTIGKQHETDKTLMYPNPNYMKYFPEIELPDEVDRSARATLLSTGGFIVIEKIIKEYGLDKSLKKIIGKDYGLFLDLVSYSLLTEDNASSHYQYYARRHPLFTENMKIYSDSKISSFFQEITQDQATEFLNDWNLKRDHREKIYISYDSTNKTCQAGDIDLAQFGHSKDGSGKPIINYAIAYDRTNSEPLFYEDYPGSIVDVSELQYMLEKASAYGYKRVGFILDRGYFSEENIHYMDKMEYEFIIMMKGIKRLVRDEIIAHKGSFENDRGTSIREFKSNGITIPYKFKENDKNQRYLHIYYSSKKYQAEREALEQKVDKLASTLKKHEGTKCKIDKSFEKYFNLIYQDEVFIMAEEKKDVVNKEMELCGYYCILTSSNMSAKDALRIYKSRDESEKVFMEDKSYLGARTLRVHSEGSIEAKIFLGFIALIIRCKIYTSLNRYKSQIDTNPNYLCVPIVLEELDSIELHRDADGVYRLDHALTKTQKDILKAFGIDLEYVKKKVKEISERIGNK